MTCWCGTAHAVPSELYQFQLRQHNDGRTPVDIYCPLGHAHVPAGKSKWATEREAREAAEARASSLADQLDAANREARRLAKRTAKGVCPCCKRSFVNLRRHMEGQHPQYEPT